MSAFLASVWKKKQNQNFTFSRFFFRLDYKRDIDHLFSQKQNFAYSRFFFLV